MEKNTVLAIVLSMLVVFGFIIVPSMLNPPPALPPVQESQGIAQTGTSPEESVSPPPVETGGTAAPIPQGATGLLRPAEEEPALERIVIETDLIRVVLTNAGGNIVSYQLLGHFDAGEPVEMIFPGDAGPNAFAVAFGSLSDVTGRRVSPDNRNFRVQRISNYIVEFSQDFYTLQDTHFSFTKRYEFRPGEYMFELSIDLNGGMSTRAFDFQGAAYTLIFSPQIGPQFARLDQRYEFRHYLSYRDRMRTERVNEREPLVLSNQPSWAAIAGKYFVLAALPLANQYDIAFATQPEPGLPAASRLMISRPASNMPRIEDRYRFYLGPKNEQVLSIYDRGNNSFRLQNSGLVNIAETRGFLAPLERVLKWFLLFFHGIIPNYGIAIILTTLLVKIAFFPLTKKGSEATLRMQTLAPRIKEIQEKYKDNKQKQNQEMAEFYKKEGYNPIAGCLPMLLQLPLFIAMYNLFNNHFDLRGAEFIPFWITDLSRPEFIFEFPEGFRLPILGWTALRALPFIYVGSQLLYGKVTQTPEQRGNNQMKMMLYLMPLVFFFILYDVPSGLLVYWIMSNVLTMVQQVLINKYMRRKKAAAPAAAAKPVIAPGGSKKKKRNR